MKVKCIKEVYSNFNLENEIDDVKRYEDVKLFEKGQIYEVLKNSIDQWETIDETGAWHIIRDDNSNDWFEKHFLTID